MLVVGFGLEGEGFNHLAKLHQACRSLATHLTGSCLLFLGEYEVEGAVEGEVLLEDGVDLVDFAVV